MTDEEMIRQVYQAMFGIANTDERGMVGDIREIRKAIQSLSDTTARLNGKVNNLIWYLIGAGILTAGAGAGLLKVALG